MGHMNTPEQSPLGRELSYPSRYDAGLLFPIPRSVARTQIGIVGPALPFVGHDRWQLYELSWLDAHGKPQVACATLWVPGHSPQLVESKSLKLYLNSLNDERIGSAESVRALIETDVGASVGAPVQLQWGLAPVVDAPAGECLDDLPIGISHYGPPQANALLADADALCSERLYTALFKSNCPVTGQPDWASLIVDYCGPRIDRAGLLRYLMSFRHHNEFHEQCVERIFTEIAQRCAPQTLTVEARFTRRGGVDINPWRATPGQIAPPPQRDPRQ